MLSTRIFPMMDKGNIQQLIKYPLNKNTVPFYGNLLHQSKENRCSIFITQKRDISCTHFLLNVDSEHNEIAVSLLFLLIYESDIKHFLTIKDVH